MIILAWVVTLIYAMLIGGFLYEVNQYSWKDNILSIGVIALPLALGIATIMGLK